MNHIQITVELSYLLHQRLPGKRFKPSRVSCARQLGRLSLNTSDCTKARIAFGNIDNPQLTSPVLVIEKQLAVDTLQVG